MSSASTGRRLRAWWAYQQGLMLRFWGHRLVRRDMYRASVAAFTRALLARPELVEAYLARGLVCWRELHDMEQAIFDFSEVLRLQPHRSEALFYRGMAYQAGADYQSAADDLRAALQLTPDALWGRNAHHQLMTIEAILDDLPASLGGSQPDRLTGGSD
jgi:tetratricopeptide (TPR) repeat protein